MGRPDLASGARPGKPKAGGRGAGTRIDVWSLRSSTKPDLRPQEGDPPCETVLPTAAAAALLAAPALAATVTRTVALDGQGRSATATFQPFDASLGTLTVATVALDVAAATTGTSTQPGSSLMTTRTATARATPGAWDT